MKKVQSVHSRKFGWLINTEIIRHHYEGTVPILKSQDVFSLINSFIHCHLGASWKCDFINMIFIQFWSKSIPNREITAGKKTPCIISYHVIIQAQYLRNKRRRLKKQPCLDDTVFFSPFSLYSKKLLNQNFEISCFFLSINSRNQIQTNKLVLCINKFKSSKMFGKKHPGKKRCSDMLIM